jgi:glycosyltransferase involved in cell wall biosynthesis
MGFKKSKKKKDNGRKEKVYPFVSICTPTFNRRPFIPFMIKCFEHQTYPRDRMEWIIIDDGTDPIGDLVSHIPEVKYFYFEEKMELGKKRNLMHTKCSGDIFVYMDDDDYYPPERVSHAVEMLQTNPKVLFAGASKMYIYFNSKNKIYQCGPYAPYHATAATFAFRKQLLEQTSYEDSTALSEESKFTQNYSIPLIQLNSMKTILVFSHKHNSLNKEKLLTNPVQYKTSETELTVGEFIRDPELMQFYMHDMNTILENYSPGNPENKVELMRQLKQKEEEYSKNMKEHTQMQQMQREQELRYKQLLMTQYLNENSTAITPPNEPTEDTCPIFKTASEEINCWEKGDWSEETFNDGQNKDEKSGWEYEQEISKK